MNEDEDTAIIPIMSLIRVHSWKRRRKEKKKNFRWKNYDRVSNYNKKYIFALGFSYNVRGVFCYVYEVTLFL